MILKTLLITASFIVGAAPVATADALPSPGEAAALAGLRAPVHVERDDLGIPVIRGESLEDVIRAQGFVHAQDRFFQMDVTRRLTAGRLADLLGPALLDMDRDYRRYRFDVVAFGVIERLPEGQRRLLDAYADGVNAGLRDLAAAPAEYALLQSEPQEWRSQDAVLVLLSMFHALTSTATLEQRVGIMAEVLPAPLVEFLTPIQSRFRAPLLERADDDGPAGPLPIPGPEVVDLRTRTSSRGLEDLDDLVDDAGIALGSNSWAVAGAQSAHGGAMLANDPHLRLTVPGIWHRSHLDWGGGWVSGLGFPGTPGIVLGSNGHVAWGMTNSLVDVSDLVVIEVDPDDPGRYLTPDGSEPFEEIREVIEMRGRPAQVLTLLGTRWGIVHDEDASGRPLALRWTALDPDMINFRLLDMMRARTLEEGVETARGWYGPSQNVLLADDTGRIAWVVSGYLPRRVGLDGKRPVSWAARAPEGDLGRGWHGPQAERLRPVIVDPPDGILFTANNRTVDLAWARRLGGSWALGARAERIAERLRAGDALTEADLLALQLDTRVKAFDFYRDLVLEVCAGSRGAGLLASARDVVAAWDGTAAADEPGLPILDAYRRGLRAAVFQPLVAPCRAVDDDFRYSWRLNEEPLRRILEERPVHLLPPAYETWDALLREVLVTALEKLLAKAPDNGLRQPWGAANISAVHHPITRVVPALGPRLNMPDVPLPGHSFAVRVSRPGYGASARMVVSPGREASGLLHIPAGQSGNPASPHYRDSHPAWVEGRATPFLPGEARSMMMLVPSP